MNSDTALTHHARAANEPAGEAPACMGRRPFLLAGASVVLLGGLPMADADAAPLHALRRGYPRVRVGRLSALRPGLPAEFNYPYPNVRNLLVKLGAPAGGGVGTEVDVVAFNQQCTHMGGPLAGSYKAGHQMLGPCPRHLSSFDLTRHGMVVSGHATQSLPQIVLETLGDDIFAVGVQGLLYGYSANTADPRL